MDFILKVTASSLEYFSTILLAMALFRLKINKKFRNITLVSILLSIVIHFSRDFLGLEQYTTINVLILKFTLFVLILSIPIFLSMLMVIITILATSLIELFTYYLIVTPFLIPNNHPNENAVAMSLVFLITAAVISCITYLLNRYKIGFMFSHSSFLNKSSHRGYHVVLCSILIIAVFVMHLASWLFNKNSFNGIFPVIIVLIFFGGLFFSVKHEIGMWITQACG